MDIPYSYRMILGLLFFITMGFYDLKKNPSNPKRFKEYLFIASCSIFAIVFGIFHDFVTFSISKEYFFFGKALGINATFFPDVVQLAIKASYSIGMIFGVLVVVANNPYRSIPQLPYKRLINKAVFPIVCILLCEIIAIFLSSAFFPFFSQGGEGYLKNMKNYEMVAFIHWGTYVGALIGSLISIYLIYRERKLLIKSS